MRWVVKLVGCLVVVGFLLSACSFAAESGASEGETIDGATEIKDPIYKYPTRLSDILQCQLKYPIEVYTVAYWGNGRFNIYLTQFYDEEAEQGPCVFRDMEMFRDEGGMVYAAGREGFLFVDTFKGVVEKYASYEDVSEERRTGFDRLRTQDFKDNVYFDPETMLLREEPLASSQRTDTGDAAGREAGGVKGPIYKRPNTLLDIARCRLKYPIEVMTVAYWGNGRFRIRLTGFYDATTEPETDIDIHLEVFRDEGGWVYSFGREGFLFVDTLSGLIEKYATYDEIPEKRLPGFDRLKTRNFKGNRYFDYDPFLEGEEDPRYLSQRPAEDADADGIKGPIYKYPRNLMQIAKSELKIGVDTVAYWGDGRFNICLNHFNDEEKGEYNNSIFSEMDAFRDEGGLVYASGEEGFLFVDTFKGVFEKYASYDDIPQERRPGFDRLRTPDFKGNEYFDPDTLKPREKPAIKHAERVPDADGDGIDDPVYFYPSGFFDLLTMLGTEYLIRLETIAFWRQGRYQIALRAFYDQARGQDALLFDGLDAFRDEGGRVYVAGRDGFLFVDTLEEVVEKYASYDEIPEKRRAGFERLRTQDFKGNVYFDPAAFRPSEEPLPSSSP